MSAMMFMPSIDCESQRACIEAREVAARWSRLSDAELLVHLFMLGSAERRLVVDALREHGVEVGGRR